jgi:catechol 2,3-dioxygenase-like lactoylglutathione lyase family enzyme
MIKMKGLVHFTIPVKDLSRSEAFYKDLLGFEVVRKNDHMIFMRCGDDNFVLAYSKQKIDPNPVGDHGMHTAFRVDPEEYDSSIKYLAGNGVPIIHESPNKTTGTFQGRSVYFHDPDKNVLELLDQTN